MGFLLGFRVGFLRCLSAVDYGFGMFVFGIAFMAAVYYSRVSSVYVNPRGSIPFPRVVFIVVFSCVTTHFSFATFSVRHPRHLLLKSPGWLLPPSLNLWFFVRRFCRGPRASTLECRRGLLPQMQVVDQRVILAVTFVCRSIVFINYIHIFNVPFCPFRLYNLSNSPLGSLSKLTRRKPGFKA